MKNINKKQLIKGSIVMVLYLLFLIWAKSWLGLIVVPLLFDIYFTKFIPWGFWRKMKPSFKRTIFSWIDAIVFALIAVTMVNIFIFQNYQIPSSSLEKSLLIGDHLYVSKLSYGPRIPNTPIAMPFAHNTMYDGKTKSYSDVPFWKYKRITGFGKIQRNDIVVFNYPAGDTVANLATNFDFYKLAYEIGYNINPRIPNLDDMSKVDQLKYFDNIYRTGKENISKYSQYYGDIITRPVDRRDNYVKRCLGIPGDTLEIIDSQVYVNGNLNPDAADVQFNYYVQTTGPEISQELFKELGINKDDQSIINRDVIVESKANGNKVIFRQQGVNNQSLEEILTKYSDSNQFNVIVTNHALTNFLSDNGFDDAGFVAKGKFIYHLPLTKQMVNTLSSKKGLISHIIQEPSASDMLDASYMPLLIYPLNGNTGWDKNNYGPIWIPKEGATITLTLDNYAIYERCIRTYEGNDLAIKDGHIYINGQLANEYTFKMDYYWMMGDNRDQSLDSRYWGFVPIDHIVGKPKFIWLSLEKDNSWFNGKIRWNRFFKWVK